jgi:hypothetical protein
MIERFCKELYRTLSHRLNPHPGISVSSNEDDRDIASLFFQPGLQLQTRHLWHKDVSDQARGLTVQTGCEEFFRGSKALCDQPSRLDEIAESPELVEEIRAEIEELRSRIKTPGTSQTLPATPRKWWQFWK